MQDDIPVEKYRAFAAQPQFAAVGRLSIISVKNKRCTATLVDPFTLLTAAHCFDHFLESWFDDDEAEIEYSLGPHFRNIVGVRRSKFIPGLSRMFTDLALVYLDTPIYDVDLPKLPFSNSNSRGLERRELEFAGYGQALIAPAGFESEEPKGVKLAGKSIGLLVSNDLHIEGLFRPNENRESLNALGADGDSGAALFVKQTDLGYQIVGVFTRSSECTFPGEWDAVLLAGHLDFIKQTMAYKDIETRPSIATIQSDWDDSKTWRTVADKSIFEERVNNREHHRFFDDQTKNGDSTEDILRRFSVHLSRNVVLNRDARVTQLHIHSGGKLALTRGVRLDAQSISIDGGEVAFVIGDVSFSQLHAENELEFRDATLDIDFRLFKQNTSDRDSILKQPNWIDSDRSISSSLVSGTIGLLTSYLKQPKLKREWTIALARRIQGEPKINIRNVPENFFAKVRQDSASITVHLLEK